MCDTPVAAANQQTAQSQTVTKKFNLPAGPLGDALFVITTTFDVNIIADEQLIKGNEAPAISGVMTAEDAINGVLKGSGLSVSRSTNGAYVISQRTLQTESPLLARAVDQVELETPEVERITIIGSFQQSLIDRLPITPKELPFTLNTLGREDINERGFIRPIEILDTLPNVQLRDDPGYGNPSFLLRGFEAPILVNNRVTNPSRGPGQPDDAFVEQYEVLKGPASIALGPIAGGGVINAVTKLPEQEDFIDLHVAADQFGSVRSEFDINKASLLGSDAFSFRLSGAVRDFEFDAEQVDRQEISVRPVFLFDNGGATTATFSIGYKRTDSVPNVSFPLFDDGSVPPQFGTDTFFGSANTDVVGKDLLIDTQIRHEFLDNLTLTVRGSFQDTESDYQDRGGLYNYTGNGFSPSNPFVYAYSQVSVLEQETRFLDAQLLYSFTFAGREQSIVVGTSYDEGDIDFFQGRFGQLGPFLIDEIDLPRIGSPQESAPEERTSWVDQNLYSVYVEAVIRPTDRFTIVGGLRYDDNKDALVIPGNDRFSRSQDESVVTGRVGITYEINDDINAFVSFAEAFIPQVGITRSGEQVEAERSENFEIGFKGTLLDGALGFDVAAFSTTRFNLAVDDPEDAGDFTSIFRVTIGEQVNEGVELNLNYLNKSGLRFDLGFGYLDQKIKASAEDAVSVVNAPDYQVSAFATYTFQQGILNGLSIGGGVRHFGERPSSNPIFEFPNVTVADAFASYPINRDTTVQLNVLNLFDQEYLESAGFGNTQGLQRFGAPRTAIVSINTRF